MTRPSEHKEIRPALTLALVLFGAVLAVSAWREWDVRQPAPGTIGSQDSCRCCKACDCPLLRDDCPCKKTPAQFVKGY